MMLNDAPQPAQAAIRTDLGAIFVSMELSRRVWLITSLSPGAGEKMSKHSVPASDVPGLLHRFAELKRKATARSGRDFPIIVIQEAGLVLLRQEIASSGVTVRATLREHFLWETGHERGPAGTVYGLCRCADRGDRACRSGRAVA